MSPVSTADAPGASITVHDPPMASGMAVAAPERAPGAPAGEKHLRVAPDLASRRRRTRLLAWGATLVTVASLFALVAFHVLAVQQSFALDRLTEQREAEARRYEHLRKEVAAASAPEAIVEAARALGMEFATGQPQQIEALPAAPTAPADEQTSITLNDGYDGTKSSLEP